MQPFIMGFFWKEHDLYCTVFNLNNIDIVQITVSSKEVRLAHLIEMKWEASARVK